MESINGWQTVFLGGIASWVVFSSLLNVTQKIRSITKPWVFRQVISGTPTILKIQVRYPLLMKFTLFIYFSLLGKKIWRKWRFLLMMDVDMDPWYLIKPDCFYTLALFAEIQAQIFGCFVFRVVVRCFRALLYCFSSFPFLGTCPPVTWFNGNFIINYCFIIFIIIAYFMENGYGGWIVEWTCQIS